MAGSVEHSATKTAGVLGGMGPDATIDFMSKVISMTPADADQDHVRMLVNHNPKVPDRQIDTDEQRLMVRETLASMAQGLEQFGADFLVMPCNTAHGFLDLAIEQTTIPFINIVDETIAEITALEPDAASVGVLAADMCLQGNLYQTAIHDAGMSVLLPSAGEQQLIMKLVFRIKGGDQGSEVAHDMLNIANSLIQRGADVLVAGCTEIPLVLSAERMTVPLISSTDVLAARTVALCLGHTPLPAT